MISDRFLTAGNWEKILIYCRGMPVTCHLCRLATAVNTMHKPTRNTQMKGVRKRLMDKLFVIVCSNVFSLHANLITLDKTAELSFFVCSDVLPD